MVWNWGDSYGFIDYCDELGIDKVDREINPANRWDSWKRYKNGEDKMWYIFKGATKDGVAGLLYSPVYDGFYLIGMQSLVLIKRKEMFADDLFIIE